MMTDEAATDEDGQADVTETALEAAIWMMQDMGIAVPPLPRAYLGDIREFGVNSLYGTSSSLVALSSRDALGAALEPDKPWPAGGVAFGFLRLGLGGLWFYTLVGEQAIAQVSLRLSFHDKDATARGIASVNAAHLMLERHLTVEGAHAQLLRPYPPAPSIPRRVISYAAGWSLAEEAVATWTEGEGLGDFVPAQDLFTLPSPARPGTQELINFRC